MVDQDQETSATLSVDAREDWEQRLRARGLWAREQERTEIERKLNRSAAKFGIWEGEEVIRALSYDEWLAASVLFEHPNYCSYRRQVLRQRDKWLWEYKPEPFSEDSITSYLFSWDDVAALRVSDQVTTQEEWDVIVNERYEEVWQEYTADFREPNRKITA